MVRHIFAAAVISLVGISVAQAQSTVPKPIITPDGQTGMRGKRPTEAPPAAVPGARADSALSAPAERSGVDMPPTEALFDSINRGDVVAAREAIGRGADIHGRNILGLTPLEQAVDLGRNDISFLLLSLRSGLGYNTVAGGPSQPAAPLDRRAAAQETARARREQRDQARATAAAAKPAAPRTAHLFAGDGGAPVPQAGFLGFDSAR
ncbi:MAG: hypothetical protein ACRYF2_07675 [Janthinobacterium lividum]